MDSFARLGGEEFGLLLPETQQLDALLVADRLRTAVARQEVIPGRRVTLSGGLASCPQDAVTADELEQRADAALYWAKRNGKNICAVASEVTTEEPPADDGRGRACPTSTRWSRRSTPSRCTRATTRRTWPPTRWRSARSSG